jgi:hypothetical protein
MIKMDTRLKIFLSIGLIMICLGLVAVFAGAELGWQRSSGQPEAEQNVDRPQYTKEVVINIAKDYLEAEYLYDVENEIARSQAEYIGNGLWKVEFYGRRPQATCPRQADSPLKIVYVDEQTGAFG